VPSAENTARQREIQITIENLLEQEEIYWLQRERANRLLHGDRNTSFFHNVATSRKKRNKIKNLDDTDVWCEGTDQLKYLIPGYFSNLIASEVTDPDPEVIAKS
jgi:hypothetical protein